MMEPKTFFVATVDGTITPQAAITAAERIRERIPNPARVIFAFSDEDAYKAFMRCLHAELTMSDRDVFYVRSTNYTDTVTGVIPSLIDEEASIARDAGQRNETLMRQYRSEHPLVVVFMPLSKACCDESAFKGLDSIIDDVARQGHRLAIAGVDSAEPTVISNVTAMAIMPPLQHGDSASSIMELAGKFGCMNVMLYP